MSFFLQKQKIDNLNQPLRKGGVRPYFELVNVGMINKILTSLCEKEDCDYQG